MAQGLKRGTKLINATVVGSISIQGLNLIFLFLRSGIARRGVDFGYSTRNALKTYLNGEESVSTVGS